VELFPSRSIEEGSALDGGRTDLHSLGYLERKESQDFRGVAALPTMVFHLIVEEMKLRKVACGGLELDWL
jgi:hypothetical protein